MALGQLSHCQQQAGANTPFRMVMCSSTCHRPPYSLLFTPGLLYSFDLQVPVSASVKKGISVGEHTRCITERPQWIHNSLAIFCKILYEFIHGFFSEIVLLYFLKNAYLKKKKIIKNHGRVRHSRSKNSGNIHSMQIPMISQVLQNPSFLNYVYRCIYTCTQVCTHGL